MNQSTADLDTPPAASRRAIERCSAFDSDPFS
jgi:hypothetical protein